MTFPILLCAGACVLLLGGGATAHETGKPHKHHRTHKAQVTKPPQPKARHVGPQHVAI